MVEAHIRVWNATGDTQSEESRLAKKGEEGKVMSVSSKDPASRDLAYRALETEARTVVSRYAALKIADLFGRENIKDMTFGDSFVHGKRTVRVMVEVED